jgi:hypothetical protein
MDMTFRPRSNLAWAGVSLVLIILFAANSFTVATNLLQTVFELIICLLLGALVYLLWLRPKLVLQEKVIQVVNPFRTELIPYRDVRDLETKWALTIIHNRGKTRVWVAPASGKRRWISNTTFGWSGANMPLTKIKDIGSESMSASLESFSGQAAYLIRERIKKIH